MATITFKGDPVETVGTLPASGTPAPAFTLCGGDLSDVTLASLAGKTVLLNIVPSLDTSVCVLSAKRFNQEAAARPDTVMLTVSADLPFAQGRVCGEEGIESIQSVSSFRSTFGTDYQVAIAAGPLAGILSRAIVIIDANGVVTYSEQVPEIAQEPDYDAALAALA